MSKKYAIFAGNGDLPHLLQQYFIDDNIPFIVIGFDGMTQNQNFLSSSFYSIKIGNIGKILSLLKEKNVTHITMAGSIKRPSIKDLSLDLTGSLWLAKMGTKIFDGDNALLSALINLIEKEGFFVVSPHSLLKGLCEQKGILTKNSPCAEDEFDIKRGVEILKILSPFDVGQAIIVQQGLVLGVEAIEGTQELLHRIISYKRGEKGGVLVKIPKLNQSIKVDMPTIGPDTIAQCVQAKLNGIAIAYQGTQIIHFDQCIDQANQNGLFIVALKLGLQ